jgi:acylphosphatase
MLPRGNLTTVGLRISGRVQGVCYRGWAVGKATELGLSGWVRNVTDGTVEILINGPKDQVDEMIASSRLHWSINLGRVGRFQQRGSTNLGHSIPLIYQIWTDPFMAFPLSYAYPSCFTEEMG